MIIFSLRIIQFAPVFMFASAAYSLQHNACMIENEYNPIEVDNEVVVCDKLWVLPKYIYAISFLGVTALCLNELRLYKKRSK